MKVKRKIMVGLATVTALLSLALFTQPAEAAPSICTVFGYIQQNINGGGTYTVIQGAPTLGLPINNSVFVQDNNSVGRFSLAFVNSSTSGAYAGVVNTLAIQALSKGWVGFSVEC